MKIIISPDSFKESLTAAQAAEAMAYAVELVAPQVEKDIIPLADGGEGTVDALVASTNGRYHNCQVINPLGERINARYGILGDNHTAIIEMAAASGLTLIDVEQRNPMLATTFGTGQMIKDAIAKGCDKIIIGIGGSATNDCGTGMAQALGVKFYDQNDNEITGHMNGELLQAVKHIDVEEAQKYQGIDIIAACDVDNPLLGEQGAVMIFSEQKGADAQQRIQLENNMRHISKIIEQTTKSAIIDLKGAGAAGGLGAGLVAFLQAKLNPGIDLVLDACNFDQRIADARLVLTGEGRIDHQTKFGKTISGILKRTRTKRIPVIAFAGSIDDRADNLYAEGLLSMVSICSGPMNLEHAQRNAAHLLQKATERILRVFFYRTSF